MALLWFVLALSFLALVFFLAGCLLIVLFALAGGADSGTCCGVWCREELSIMSTVSVLSPGYEAAYGLCCVVGVC